MNVVELRDLAEHATPGPWRLLEDDGELGVASKTGPGWVEWIVREPGQERDAAYLAAVSPDTVLRLLDVFDRATELIAGDLDTWYGTPLWTAWAGPSKFAEEGR